MYENRRFDRPLPPIEQGKLPTAIEEKEDMHIFQGMSREAYGDRLEAWYSPEAKSVFEKVCQLSEAIRDQGGRALLVGGAVRDEIVGQMSKDFDVEIYGIDPDTIERLAQSFGKVDAVGKAFGILKLTDGSGFDIDISLPRTDSKVGEGHRGFEVKVDPSMSIAEAAKRRDFTFNSMAKDPLTAEIFDPFGGVEDLRTRTLRVTDPERFQDDPLRVMRAAQFVARLGLRIEPESMKLMQSMLPELKSLPKERFQEEWKKLLLKADKPSMGLQALFDIGVIHELYPELADLKKTPQEFEWHPEGDVWIHTLMVVDSAAQVVKREQLSGDMAHTVMLGALCHDLGKPIVTQVDGGRIRAKGHEPAGDQPTRDFLAKIATPNIQTEKVVATVKDHLWPSMQYFSHLKGTPVSDGAFRKLAKRIHPATIAELTWVAEADHMGRGPFLDKNHLDQFLLPDPYKAGDWTRKKAEALGVEHAPSKPLLQGRDLLALGLTPDKSFGEIIRLAEQLRDDKNMPREEILLLMRDAMSSSEIIQNLSARIEG